MTNTLASVVFAIWLAEGGTNASVPYGILSVPVRKVETNESNTNRVRLRSEVCQVRKAGRANGRPVLPSVSVQDQARQICERTIVNNVRRWQAAGRPGCYFDFLGDRYVPAATDPRGNVKWKRNVRALLNHRKCNCMKP